MFIINFRMNFLASLQGTFIFLRKIKEIDRETEREGEDPHLGEQRPHNDTLSGEASMDSRTATWF